MRKFLGLLVFMAVPALVQADDPVPVQPNANQVALLRWYHANEAGLAVSGVGAAWRMAYDGANIWVSWVGGNVSRVRTTDGLLLGTTYIPGAAGLAYDGLNMWVTSQTTNDVTKVRASDGVILGVVATDLHNPTDIAFDGVNMWTKGTAGIVTKINASTGSRCTYQTPGEGPEPRGTGIAFDGVNMWVTSCGSVIKLNSDCTAAGSYTVPSSSPTSIAFDGANMWVANGFWNEVTKIRVSDGHIDRFTLANAWAVAFDGVYIWVAQWSGTVSKLNVATGAIVGTYPVSAGYPTGVAFDGANIWVSGQGLSKL